MFRRPIDSNLGGIEIRLFEDVLLHVRHLGQTRVVIIEYLVSKIEQSTRKRIGVSSDSQILPMIQLCLSHGGSHSFSARFPHLWYWDTNDFFYGALLDTLLQCLHAL